MNRARAPVTGPIIVWIGLLLILIPGSHYKLFLRPVFGLLLLGSLVVLTALLVALRNGPDRCAAAGGPAPWMRFAVVSLPLVFLILTRWEPLGSYAFEMRFFEDNSLNASQEDGTAGEALPFEEVTMKLIWTDFLDHVGHRIATEGMVFRDPELPEGYFRIFRFWITCCAADARPVWAVVQHPGTTLPESDTWVRVEGRLVKRTIGGRSVRFIPADLVEAIPAPDDPYVR